MVYYIRNAKLVNILIIAIALSMPANIAFAHGGKAHSDNMLTPFAFVQKATGLYDKLISKEKLDSSWETGLKSIAVYRNQSGDKSEWVVRFSRAEGAPESVYIFFNSNGEYSGSNFTGK